MSDLKPKVDLQRITNLLSRKVGDITNLSILSGAEASQAYAFNMHGQEFVLRVNHQADFSRDVRAYELLHDSGLPIPKVISTGKDHDWYWAVSERAEGKMLYDMPLSELKALTPVLINILTIIHSVDVSSTHGYGLVDEHQNGRFEAWRDYLLQFAGYGIS